MDVCVGGLVLGLMVSIKIICYSIRGLRGLVKRMEVLNLVRDKRPWFLCIQKTKIEMIDGFVRVYLFRVSIVLGFLFVLQLKPHVDF